MIIEAIKINGYGPIKDSLEVKFKTPFSVLVGKNASGKSTILSAIRNSIYKRLGDGMVSIIPNISENTKCYIVRSTKGVIEPSPGREENEGDVADFERLLWGAEKERLEYISNEILKMTQIQVSLEKDKGGKSINVKVNGERIEKEKLSAGLQSILTIESVLNYHRIFHNEKVIFLFEELENFLHPNLIRIYIDKLRQLAEKNNHQIILTTHSNLVLSMVAPDEIIRIQDGKAYTIERLSERDKKIWDYLIDQNKSDLFFSDKVIFVEGLTDKLVLSQLLKSTSANLSSYNITIVHTDGVHHQDLIEKICKGFGIKGLFIRDCDKGRKPGSIEQKETLCTLTLPYKFPSYPYVEIEDIIPLEDWAYVLSEERPTKIFSFINDVLEESKDKFSVVLKSIKYHLRCYNSLYSEKKIDKEHPLNYLLQIIKDFIKGKEIRESKVEIKEIPHPKDVLTDSFCYIVDKDLFSDSLSVTDLISKEEKTICFGYKLSDNNENLKDIKGAISKLYSKNIPFYVISKKKDHERIYSIIDIKNVKHKDSYMEIKSNNGVKSYILCLERRLSNRDKETLLDFKPIL